MLQVISAKICTSVAKNSGVIIHDEQRINHGACTVILLGLMFVCDRDLLCVVKQKGGHNIIIDSDMNPSKHWILEILKVNQKKQGDADVAYCPHAREQVNHQ